jgi:hypothetical protein
MARATPSKTAGTAQRGTVPRLAPSATGRVSQALKLHSQCADVQSPAIAHGGTAGERGYGDMGALSEWGRLPS